MEAVMVGYYVTKEIDKRSVMIRTMISMNEGIGAEG